MGNAVKQKMNQTAIVKMNFDNYKKLLWMRPKKK